MENTKSVSESNDKAKLSSVGELFRQAIEIYKIGFKKFIGLQLVSMLGFLPLALVVGIWAFIKFKMEVPGILIYDIVFGILSFIAAIFGIYIAVLSQIGIFLLLKDFRVERTFKEILQTGKPYVLNFITTSLLVAVICLLGFVLLAVPGIIWTVVYAFASYVVVFEGLKNWQAMKRSKELVKGFWWPVALRTLVIFGISILISIPSAILPDKSTSQTVYDIFDGVISFIIAPIFITYSYLIYKNLVKIKNS